MKYQKTLPTRRASTRMPGYDYSRNGTYFITICTKFQHPAFGDIIQGQMYPNTAGTIIEQTWQNLPYLFPGLSLDQHICMPNHFHGILVITRPILLPRYPSTPISLCKIVRQFKAITSHHIHLIGQEFSWQRSYWDNILTTSRALTFVRAYIRNNPQTWQRDKLNNL